MATINLGNIKFNWKGTYAGGTAYVVDDVVSYNGSSYICKLASTGNLPTNGTYWDVMSQAGTNGTDVGTTITTQGDILYRDGSGLQRLAKPASDMFLKNTSAGAVQWAALSSDCVKLATGTVGNVSSFSVDGYFTSDYNYYRLIIMNLRNDTANRQLRWRVNQGGSAMTAGNYRFNTDGAYTHPNGSTDYNKVGGWRTDFFYNGWDLSSGSDRGSQFEFDIYDPLNTYNEKFIAYKQLVDVQDANYMSYMQGGGYYNDGGGTALSGMTFFPQADNFNTGGKWTLYGFKG